SLAPPELPRLEEVRLDALVLTSAVLVTGLVGLASGLAPIWFASRTDVNDTLRRTGAGRRSTGRGVRGALVIFDVALAFVLVAATGLMGQSLWNLKTLDAGFDATGV